MSQRGHEIARVRQFGNFKPSKYAKKPKKERARDRREGMSEAHLAAVRKLWCPIARTRNRIEAHHCKGGPAQKFRGLGLKSPDMFCVPLNALVHWRLESLGSRREEEFFDEYGINPYELADALWKASPDVDRMSKVLEAHQEQADKVVEQRTRGKSRFKPCVHGR